MDPAERAVLEQMLAAASAAPEPYRVSPFWADLAARHLEQLERSGFDSFKRTVNVRYFNWRVLGILRHQFLPVALRWLERPSRAAFGAHVLPAAHPNAPDAHSFNVVSARIYAFYVAMLAGVVGREDPRGLLRRLEEPLLGDPILVRSGGRDLTQDLCNSVHEFYQALGDVQPSAEIDVAEIGAGYGRLAWVVLSELPRATYCIIDVPPALYVSQRYLTTLLPDTAAFPFREFRSYDEVRDEFEAARLRFLQPHQATCLPDRSFDRIITISTLHEMTMPQISHYFTLFDRLCRDRVYTKQYRRSRAGANGSVLREADYPVPPHWHTVFHRRHPVQSLFFEALYRVR